MSAVIPDFRQGDTYRIKLQYPEGTDITGYKFFLTLKAEFADEDPGALQVSTTAGDDWADEPEEGLAYLTAKAEETAEVPAGKYYWDIQEITADGDIRTLAPDVANYKSRVTVVPQVTEAVD